MAPAGAGQGLSACSRLAWIPSADQRTPLLSPILPHPPTPTHRLPSTALHRPLLLRASLPFCQNSLTPPPPTPLLSGVYFERYVKGKFAASLWHRNIQLGLYGVPLSIGYALAKDGRTMRAGGVLQGFDRTAWLVIALQIAGGLLVGMVVKYCDNIL